MAVIISDDTIKTVTIWATGLGAVFGLLTALLLFFGKLREFWNNAVIPTWHKVVKPFLKLVTASATLVIPNALFIGFWMYRVATYYLEAGSIDFIITSPRVFLQLVAWQTGLVSLYSLLWAALVYPRIRLWIVFWKQPGKSG